MATETLNPNADGTTNGFGLSEGSSRFALVNDGDDTTYVEGGFTVGAAQYWSIRIDGATRYDNDENPGAANGSSTVTAFTREINSTNFPGCPTLTKDLITSLEIGMKSGVSVYTATQLFNLDDPSFPDDATINSATINGRLSLVSSKTRICEISLVVDYTEAAAVEQTLLKLKSGTLTLKGGTLTIK